MLGLLVIIVVSWVLLYFIEKRSITALGITPLIKRLVQFLVGLALMSLIMLLSVYIETLIMKVEWSPRVFDANTMGNALGYHLRSALTEDLVFRGALLFILIQRLGAKWAILISAFCFGLYHVFSYGIGSQEIVAIVYVIVITGFVGYVWAYAFDKTKSIALGLGLHVAANMIRVFFFESQPYGELLFSEVARAEVSSFHNFMFLIFKGLFPTVLTLLFLKIALRSNAKVFRFIKPVQKAEDV